MIDGYDRCSKFHPEAPLTLEPAGMTLKLGMSVQSNQLESKQDIGDTEIPQALDSPQDCGGGTDSWTQPVRS